MAIRVAVLFLLVSVASSNPGDGDILQEACTEACDDWEQWRNEYICRFQIVICLHVPQFSLLCSYYLSLTDSLDNLTGTVNVCRDSYLFFVVVVVVVLCVLLFLLVLLFLVLLFLYFSSVQDSVYALGKAHMLSTPSLRSFL